MDLVYPLSVYFAYFILGKSALFARPRAWARRVFPGWLTYPLGCVVCFTWWVGVLLAAVALVWTGWLMLSPLHLFVAPVVNLLLDETLGALERVNTPVYSMEPKGALTVNSLAAQRPGEMTTVSATSGCNTAALARDWSHCNPPPPPWVGPLPPGWTTWYTSGNGEWGRGFACTALHGRRVRTTYFNGQTGTIVQGFRNGDDCSGSWGELMYRLRWDPGQTRDECGDVPVKSCTFLDDPPFNPLDHEQTR